MTENSSNPETGRLILEIDGMHCVHCEVAIERGFARVAGVEGVAANFRTGTASVSHRGAPDIEGLKRAAKDEGYSVVAWREAKADAAERPTMRDYAEIGAVFLILAGAFLLVTEYDLLPLGFAVPDTIGYGIAFAIGLVASISTCMAVTGGLLVAMAAKYNELYVSLGTIERLKPHLYFNAGRLLSYAALGGAIGAIGSALILSPAAASALTIAASAVMILLGLQMLKVIPSLAKLLPLLPKSFAHRIHDFAGRNAGRGAFTLGALTFFLPCGFTQALQLYVLAKGGAANGALIMFAFALGTLPALLSLSALSSFATGAFQRHFLKFAGVAVILLGVLNIQYGLVLAKGSIGPMAARTPQQVETTPLPRAMPPIRQVVDMKVEGLRYIPNQFVVRQGVLVEWRIDASRAAGCGRILIARTLGIRALLSYSSINVIEFTPDAPGEYAFNCGMGMMTPGSKFTVVGDGQG